MICPSKSSLVVTMLLFNYCLVNAQNQFIDSLKNVAIAHSDDTVLVKTYNELSSIYWTNDSDSSIHYAQLAAQISKKLSYESGLADAFYNMAQAYIYSGQYDLGQKKSMKALELYRKLDNYISVAEVLNQSATINTYQGKYDSATSQSTTALTIFKEQSYLKGQASSYNALGNIAQKKGDYPLASDYLHKSLAINQKIGNTDGVADVLNNIGVIFEYQGDYEKALSNYRKAYLVYRKKGDKLGVAIGLHNAGIILKKTGYYDSAIYNFKSALASDLEIGAIGGVAYDKKELGETYLLLKNTDLAYDYLQSALKMSLSLQDPVLTVPIWIGLGNIHRIRHSYDSAKYYLNLALEKSEETELLNEKKEATKSLYELYDEQGYTKKAFHYFRVYSKIKNELFNGENIRRLASVEAEYEFEQLRNQQEQQTRLNNLKKDRQLAEAVWIRNSSIVGFLAISILAFLIYSSYRNKRIDNKKLNKLNEEVKNINSSLEYKISERTKQLRLSINKIELANQELDMFIYRSAHNLRAPVANMLGLCQLGLTDDKSNYKEYFMQLQRTVEKMDSMLSHLQRANALKNHELEASNVEVNSMITNVLVRMSAPPNYSIKNNVQKGDSCMSDPFLLNILIENLIENATKFSEDKETVVSIEINSQSTIDQELVILISDNGLGIEDTIKDNIFDMFFRGIDKQGFGLGLYEAKIIMQRLQGSIILLKSSELGSTFEIRLPKLINV